MQVRVSDADVWPVNKRVWLSLAACRALPPYAATAGAEACPFALHAGGVLSTRAPLDHERVRKWALTVVAVNDRDAAPATLQSSFSLGTTHTSTNTTLVPLRNSFPSHNAPAGASSLTGSSIRVLEAIQIHTPKCWN